VADTSEPDSKSATIRFSKIMITSPFSTPVQDSNVC
jgi:hypothetical protein